MVEVSDVVLPGVMLPRPVNHSFLGISVHDQFDTIHNYKLVEDNT